MTVTIKIATSDDCDDWLRLRLQLWPHHVEAIHRIEINDLLAEPRRYVTFLAYDLEKASGLAVGLAEIALRTDYVNGTRSSPVAFLEGIFVVEDRRRFGIGRQLVNAAENWAKESGCREFASDALLSNNLSHAMHKNLGFNETERVVFFNKILI